MLKGSEVTVSVLRSADNLYPTLLFANHVLSERSASQADIKSSADEPNNLAVDQHIDETITGLLGRIMDGTCRPLKVGCYIDVWRANFLQHAKYHTVEDRTSPDLSTWSYHLIQDSE